MHAAQREFNEAEREAKAYTADRWRFVSESLFGGRQEGRVSSPTPLGKAPDAQRIVAARKKLADAQSTLAAFELEARERTKARKRRGGGISIS